MNGDIMEKKPLYETYSHVRAKCVRRTHRQWKDYGANGIKFNFDSYSHFLEVSLPLYNDAVEKYGIADGISCVRIDKNGHYEPGNITFVCWHNNMRPKKIIDRQTVDGITLNPIQKYILAIKERDEKWYARDKAIEVDPVDATDEGMLD